jgi:hypothetical protein
MSRSYIPSPPSASMACRGTALVFNINVSVSGLYDAVFVGETIRLFVSKLCQCWFNLETLCVLCLSVATTRHVFYMTSGGRGFIPVRSNSTTVVRSHTNTLSA